MIKHIQDAISYGLFEDFRAEDSTLVTGFHECFGEQLDCEAFSSWPDENEAGVLHLALGEDKQFKISIEEEQTRQLDITLIESEMFGSAIYSPAEDGQRYEAFATSKDRIVYDENGSACAVWLRSAYVSYSSDFCMVGTSGNAGIDVANYSCGVALGFCV